MVKRSEQLQILQLYRSRFETKTTQNSSQNSTATTTAAATAPATSSAVPGMPLSLLAVVDSIGESSSIKRLEKLVKRM
jgi:hypothetical protein